MKILSILHELFDWPSAGSADEHDDAHWLEIADLPLNQIRYACARQGVPARPPSQTAHY
jgi:hypothetical protein